MSPRRAAPVLDLPRHREPLIAILRSALADAPFNQRKLSKLLKANPKDGVGLFSADELIAAYRTLAGTNALPAYDPALLDRLRLKPIRTRSGVTPLTVLTKPFPCPGTCIFCPNDVRMPKSYLADEPGAQRAAQHNFDPYQQTTARLQALYNIGHPLDKIEIIVLGGTWSFYPEAYQRWFIWRVFQALNEFDPENVQNVGEVDMALRHVIEKRPLKNPANAAEGDTYNQAVQKRYGDALHNAETRESATWTMLDAAQRQNESAACRSVGLVIETRPDYITPAEAIRLRRLGCTKIQLGLQSLDDAVLTANRRGHDVAAARHAIKLLRQAGFKIHAHWMPNLYGATPESDRADFRRLFDDPDFRPDELKIYPCALIDDTELMTHYRAGRWRPYTDAELIELLTECVLLTPEYCRLTRIIRDIPATDIVAGSVTSNMREVVARELSTHGQASRDIRAREIGAESVEPEGLHLDESEYATSAGAEIFLQFITEARQVAGFLRLLLPAEPSFVGELSMAAIIREVHVYGQALPFGHSAAGKAQHSGLGARLIERAAELAGLHGYTQLAVISAVGTRAYYRARGFQDGELYQMRSISPSL